MGNSSVLLKRLRLILTLISLLAIAGCQKYQDKPLTIGTVQKQLAVPEEHRIQTSVDTLKNPLVHPLTVDFKSGLTPEQLSVVAVVVNPGLRAERDQRQIASAQLLQAGLLPNPQFVGGLDFPYNSSPPDNFTAYTAGLEWEVTSLITHSQKQRAARLGLDASTLDVAWREWQVAQQAKASAWAVLALQAQLRSAQEVQDQLSQSAKLLHRAVEEHNRTMVDLAAAQASEQDALQIVLTQDRDLAHQRLVLNSTLGFPPDRSILLKPIGLPTRLDPPPSKDLVEHLEERRLDLLALKNGYQSQDATLRAAILAQFPKITLGFSNGRDTSNVHTFGLGVAIDIPIFDRNQAVIATETATRQKLFDEYVNRVFNARSDIAIAVADIRAVNDQIAASLNAIPALAKLVQTYNLAMAQGNLDALSLYTAQSTLAQKKIDVIKLQQQLVQNWIALEIASGQYLPMDMTVNAASTREAQP
jgi:outer membrane protein TolC